MPTPSALLRPKLGVLGAPLRAQPGVRFRYERCIELDYYAGSVFSVKNDIVDEILTVVFDFCLKASTEMP